LISESSQRRLNRAKKQADYERKRYAEIREWAIAALGGKCVHCGSTENLEIHDIIPVLQGRGYRSGWSTVKRWKVLIPQGKMRLCCRECHVPVEHNGNTNALKKLKNGDAKK
jgi:hypothetical protein